jgi:outer membrane biosynthesis protein TonB
MRFPIKCVLFVLPLFLTACTHKQQTAQLPPLAPPEAANIPPAPNSPPPPNETIPTQPTQKAPTPAQPADQPVKKKKKPKSTTDSTTEQASNTNPSPSPASGSPSTSSSSSEVSAIGQLSSGDPEDVKRQTEDSIASIEHGLQGINRTLDDTEQKTADHIREYIKEAKAAIASGDMDGARNLTTKARVLLNELTGK